MKVIATGDKRFPSVLRGIMERGAADDPEVEGAVRSIIADVRKGGDRALAEYTKKFDGVDLKGKIEVSARAINAAIKKVSKKDLKLMEFAASRIETFHRRQTRGSWFIKDDRGSMLGQRITPLERVGIYVPGGKAAYPSTVLMNAIPARVAGVDEVVMVTPPGKGGKGGKRGISPHVLAAAKVAGVKRVMRVGGAQAVAALAYGTRTVPRVDKIVGPGNVYVVTAKRLVFGAVDIDMIAGPSEILIINDGTGDPAWIAADLLGQAEHDELASSVLITTSKKMAEAVRKETAKQLKKLKRRAIAEKSIADYGTIFIARTLRRAAEISNRIAPEHLELFVEKPLDLLGRIRNAGAIFLGAYSPEAGGDYLAGPNHTLPTGGTARFSSPLGVYDFIKRSSVIQFSKEEFLSLAPSIERFARVEGLEAHAKSVTIRRTKK